MTSPSDAGTTKKGVAISRRSALLGIPLLPFAMRSLAQQQSAEPIPVSKLHSFGLRVSDVERSLEFYQGLFGMRVLDRPGDTVSLQIGNGPQHFTLAPTRSNEQPHISHFGLSVPDYNLDRIQNRLSEHGITRTMESSYGQDALDRAGLTWAARRPGDSDGMMTDNQQLFLADHDGITVLLTSPRSCGGGGRLGDDCNPEPAPANAGLIQLIDINHFTSYVANYQRSNRFYRNLFGLENQALQGDFPTLGIGDGRQFLMFVGGTRSGDPEQPGRIDHASLAMADFDAERVRQTLSDYGLSPRQDEDADNPMEHWVSMRMPERGGAPGGTPEIYFSDPDGIHIQLQHVDYCGGGGPLGDDCG